MPIGASVAAAGASLGGAAIQANAAGSAAKAGQTAAQNSLNFVKQVYGQAQNNLNPTISQGTSAGSALGGLLGLNGNTAAQNAFSNYLNSTNYKFLLNQGEQGIEYGNAPAFNSGATAKALTNYAEGQAGSALSGYEGLLAGEQQLGTNAALGLGGIGTQTGGLVSNANAFGANASGLGSVASGNAYGGALSGLSSLLGQYSTQSSFNNNNSAFTPDATSTANMNAFNTNPLT